MSLINKTRLFLLILLASLLCACAGAKPNIAIPATLPKSLVLKKRPDVAIVLGAGGARGFAHAGVLKVLQDAGVPINLVVGASAGAFYGALFADSGNAEQAKKIMLSATFWDLADLANTPSLKGAIQGYHFQKFLLNNMRARWFNQLSIPLVVATTDLKTGKLLAISSGPVAPAAEASASMPGAVVPADLYGHILIDGGMIDPIPVDIAASYHPKVIIAVNISQQLSKKMPRTAIGVYDRGYHISWLELSVLSERKANVVIRPKVGEIGTFEISKKYELFHEGEMAAYKALPAILKILKEKHIALCKKSHY